ncbi:MAG: ApaG [uncultured bacterium]|nr:MAG: ApaG [uncultured bacterium]
MSEAVTNSIRVSIESQFLEDESSDEQFVFTYHVRISNEGMNVVQLLSRHWIITDADGLVEEVKGPGVIGYQPILKPGETFEYSSFCPLKTPIGTMHGNYQMVNENGEPFNAKIAPFRLAIPHLVQ